jgi:hypothetical protein
LLIKDANRRYTVDEVLRHKFLVDETPQTILQTANYLLRNDSKRDLSENFAAFERIKMQHERLSNSIRPTYINAPAAPNYPQQQWAA